MIKDLTGKEIIRFYKSNRAYGFLSNLYKNPVKFDGRLFPTSEHAYQFGKFRDGKVREWAMKCPKPHLLAIFCHNLLLWDIVENWNKIKVDRMYRVLKAKFLDPELKKKLIETGNSKIEEDSKTDYFWGRGKTGKGKNMLGNLLMKVRDEING